MRSPGGSAIEWPTVAVAAVLYTGFATLTWLHADLPWWVIGPVGGLLVAWHGSLQHEVIHGHPTRWRALNHVFVFPSLWLWLPFGRYRVSHLGHHRDPGQLTDPAHDPESYYVSRSRWNRMGPLARGARRALNTLAGRLLLGPTVSAVSFWRDDARVLAGGDAAAARAWLTHLSGAAIVLWWVVSVCDIAVGEYVLLYVYPGISLTLLRSYAEHRAHEDVALRTACVESGGLLSLLFLHNNLHVVHHREPGLAWYRIPARWREIRGAWLAQPGVVHFSGYAEVARRFALRVHQPVVHPAG